MILREQFEAMKEGDKVWVDSGRHGWSLMRFKRTTKTILVLTFKGKDHEYKFDIDTGRKKGTDRWTMAYAEPFTDKHQALVDQTLSKRKVLKVLEQLQGKVKGVEEYTQEHLDALERVLEKF